MAEMETIEVVQRVLVPKDLLRDFIVTFLDQTMGEYDWWGRWSEADGTTLPPQANPEELRVERAARLVVDLGGALDIEVEDGVNDGKHDHRLDLANLLAACIAYAEARGQSVSDMLDNHDANDSDNVVQRALLKEVVFA